MGIISKRAGGISALGLALGAAMTLSQPAEAAVTSFNFELLADSVKNYTGFTTSDGEQNWIDIDGAYDGYRITDDSFDVTNGIYYVGNVGVRATGSNNTYDESQEADSTNEKGKAAYAFLDSGSAGLGVCSTSDQSNGRSGCSTQGGNEPGDDNVNAVNNNLDPEKLKLTFFEKSGGSENELAITGATFRNAGHNAANGTIIVEAADGTTYRKLLSGGTFSDTGFLASLGTYSMISFLYDTGAHIIDANNDCATVSNGCGATQFYLSTITTVPLPAGVLLLGSALGGLSLMKRRRKAA